MSTKFKNITLVCLASLFLFGFAFWSWFKPADPFSESERRALAEKPKLSLESVFHEDSEKRFMTLFESYSLDQFPLRDLFRTVKSFASFYIFQNMDNNGIYVQDGYAAQLEYPINEDSLSYAAGKFKGIYDRFLNGGNAKVYSAVIPDKGYFLAEKNGYLSMDYERFFELYREKTAFAEYIDITGALSLEDYYKTDTHWRQEKISDVAKMLADGMEIPYSSEYTENVLENPFCGVYYGQSALPLPAEEMRYMTAAFMEDCTVYDHQNGKEISFYDMEKAFGKDPYEMYLSGNLSVVTIENPNASTERELIVFRDSFGASLLPLLAQSYRKITVVDIRYVPSANLGILRDGRTSKPLIDFRNADDVLFLYSTLVLNNSSALR
ncbi:MAG: hypothetical protein E7603_02390 [Ruminococcaceae bacterium]|nr:hypothetical protein [Oscillospiraceae bacterium]